MPAIMPPARFGAALLAISAVLSAHAAVHLTTVHLTTVHLTTVHLTTVHLTTGHPATGAALTLTRVSTDPFTNLGSQHATEVEPDVFGFGRTVVGAYQAGRFFSGGASDIGWATSTNGGASWQHGMLPGVTKHLGGGPRARASDPSVVYDAKYRTWMITALGITNQVTGVGVSVSRSTDGLHWRKPVTAFIDLRKFYDKEWITCDNHAASPHYGNCYIEADIVSEGDTVIMSTSRDGGASWSAPVAPSGSPSGLGGQPLVQPDGNVVVPFDGPAGLEAFSSADGGTTWSKAKPIATIRLHGVAGNMRSGDGLPSAAMDAAGTIYLAWQDCRFRAHCSANDIVFSTSADGITWSRVRRIPIDATTSGVDHFIPGIGVDPATSGRTAKVGLYYYFFPRARCAAAICKLEVGYISSANGGKTWSAPATVAGPMKVSRIASTDQGNMVGDYIAAAVMRGKALSIFAVGKPAAAGRKFNEAMYTAGGLAITGGTAKSATGPVTFATRDRARAHLSRTL